MVQSRLTEEACQGACWWPAESAAGFTFSRKAKMWSVRPTHHICEMLQGCMIVNLSTFDMNKAVGSLSLSRLCDRHTGDGLIVMVVQP